MHNYYRDRLKALVVFIIISSVYCQSDNERANERAEKLAEMMRHDGVDRVVELSQKNMKGLLKKYNLMVVLYHAHTNDTVLRQDKYALEVRSSTCIYILKLFNLYFFLHYHFPIFTKGKWPSTYLKCMRSITGCFFYATF